MSDGSWSPEFEITSHEQQTNTTKKQVFDPADPNYEVNRLMQIANSLTDQEDAKFLLSIMHKHVPGPEPKQQHAHSIPGVGVHVLTRY